MKRILLILLILFAILSTGCADIPISVSDLHRYKIEVDAPPEVRIAEIMRSQYILHKSKWTVGHDPIPLLLVYWSVEIPSRRECIKIVFKLRKRRIIRLREILP